jgi:hypothetical protein
MRSPRSTTLGNGAILDLGGIVFCGEAILGFASHPMNDARLSPSRRFNAESESGTETPD